jgi:endonuclease YncB( thermonuclease family)
MRIVALTVGLLVAWAGTAAAQSNNKVDLGVEFSKWLSGDGKDGASAKPDSDYTLTNLVNGLLPKKTGSSTAVPTMSVEGMARADDANVLEVAKPDGAVVKIRQWGLEAPETKQWPWGPRARGELDRLLAASGGKVKCTSDGTTTRSGNLVARCFAGDTDIAATLIEGGFGVEWREVSKGAYTQLESGAQAAQRGVWSPK